MLLNRSRRVWMCAAPALVATILAEGTAVAEPKPTVVSDAEKAGNWIATALTASGYKADFSVCSLQEIERFFIEHTEDGQPKPSGLLAQDLGVRLFALGSYVGEVIRREGRGEWVASDHDPHAEINIAVRLPDGGVIWPVQRVMKRLKNGPEDNIYHYGLAVLKAH